jgi:ribosomal protein L12E/L44/L45/RPP1/RPP2
MFTTLENISESQKQELIAGLATLLVGSAAEPELTADKLQAVAAASGNALSGELASLFASTVQKVKPYVMSPGGGGGGGGGGGAAAAGGGGGAAKVEEKEEEEEVDMGGGMDMFGGDEGGGGGGDY